MPLTKLKSDIDQLGFASAVFYWIERVLARLGEPVRLVRYIFVAQPVAEQPLLAERRARAMTARLLAPGDAAFAAMPLSAETISFRFDQEAICLAVFKGETMVAYIWLSFATFDEDQVRARYVLEPAATTAWDFDVYVFPEARTGFAFTHLWDSANALLRERGVRWSLSRISAFNVASIAAHRRLRAVPIGAATFFCAGRVQIMLSRRAPFVHISPGAGSVPRIRLAAPPGPAPSTDR
jgi:hypothetical protein